MTPQEMIIGVNLLLQEMNSNVVSGVKDEEILWMLNEEQIRYINQRTRPRSNDKGLGLQQDQKRYDDLEEIITPATLDLYVRDDNSLYGYLPANYLRLLNDRTLTKDLCGATYASTTETAHFWSACYKLPVDRTGMAPVAENGSTNQGTLCNTNIATAGYKGLNIIINGVPVFAVNTYYPNGILSSEGQFELYNLILEKLNQLTDIEARWESYKDKTCIGGIVITSNSSFTLLNQWVNPNYSAIHNVNPCVNTQSFVDTFTVTDNTVSRIATTTGTDEEPNRLTPTETLYNVLNSNFGKSTFDSPVTSLDNRKINLHHTKNFIATKLKIDYFRRPRKISVLLNQGCELNIDIHQEIVDSTAKRIAAIVLSDKYKNLINENLLKE